MATKRAAIAQIPGADLKLLADAAEHGLTKAASQFSDKDRRRLTKHIKVLRSIGPETPEKAAK